MRINLKKYISHEISLSPKIIYNFFIKCENFTKRLVYNIFVYIEYFWKSASLDDFIRQRLLIDHLYVKGY